MDEKHYLAPLFEPRSVAVIGATERIDALGAVVLRNMREAGFKGALHAVNPKYDTVQGVPCFRHIGDVPGRVDLAIIVTPAGTVPGLVDECGRAGVRVAAVLSAGFGETGALGAQLEADTLEIARSHGMRLLGPNSFGVERPFVGLNATFAANAATSGSIGFVSQSGALCAAVLDYARPNRVGFSNVISLGGSADLDFGEILDYLVWDFRTEAILVYIEGIRDARGFLSAIRAAARVKPVMVLKVGRHPVGSRAAQAHTGAITGDDAVFDAALRRSGVVRLGTLTQLLSNLKGLFVHFRPRGNRLAIITNGGGPGVMAADRAGDLGIALARLSPATIARLEDALPSHSRVDNPVDLIGDSSPARYATALAALLGDDEVDGVLCLLSPLAMSHPAEVARRVVSLAATSDKPILTCWLGDDACLEAREIFRQARIPSLRTPESAVDMFSHISSYYRNQQLLTQVAAPLEHEKGPMLEIARDIVDAALAERRTILRRHEAQALLAAFHLPVVRARHVHTSAEAVEAAMQLGFPVNLKPDAALQGTRLHSIQGRDRLASTVALHLAWEELTTRLADLLPGAASSGMCVEPSWQSPCTRELMLRVWRDPVFGPVIGIGERSLDPNYWPDRAVALPPLNAFLVRDLLQSTNAKRMLGSFDGLPAADLDALEHALLRISDIICEMPWIRSLEINPLNVDDRGLEIADARIEIGQLPRHAGRYDHMAIHPYPSTLVQEWTLRDGTPIVIRPIKPEDAELNQDFVRRLSPETKYFRFMTAMRELSPALLAKLTQIDYDRELAFIATRRVGNAEQQIGVCRYTTNPDGTSCEFAIVVSDEHQHSGLGRKLMDVLIHAAKLRGLRIMKGEFLTSNERMLRFVERVGFTLRNDPEDRSIKRGELDLAKAGNTG
ncbi:MAG: GNAT family N-acetyltransferase [Candidatus Dactylopiibacterium sp.]|nr:GNAT family N-acetyltransferase [Candidatus Dactylopiibacterium sp.]